MRRSGHVQRRRRLGSSNQNHDQEPIGNYLSRDEARRSPFTSRDYTTVSLIESPPAPVVAASPPLESRYYSPPEPSSHGSYSDFSVLDTPASSPDMPCVERTPEFRTVCKSMQMKIQANGFHQPKTGKAALEATKQFNMLARRVGHDLSQTCAKLEKLALLAKKKSLFDDRMGETDELTHIIKQDIASLNRQIAQLQEFATKRSTTPNYVKNGNQSQQHSKSVVVCLQSKLATMSTEFKQVLEVRTENLKNQRSRREKFGHNQLVPSSMPPSASSGQLGSVLLSDDQASTNGSVVVDMNHVQQSRLQQQLQLIDDQDSYVRSRTEAMENIESTIVELGQIFNQLAHMVQEQGEMVQRIDSNVEDAALNVEAAHMELLKYFRSISNNRWLALKVFGILIVFFIIFIVFMV